MESITNGWEDNSGDSRPSFTDIIRNCRREISKWRKNNHFGGEEQIS